MNIDEKIGRLFVIPAFGRFMNERSPQYRELVRHVTQNHVGGVIWFASSVFEAAFLNARLQTLAKRPLLVSADLESGFGMRFPDVTWWPPAMAVAAAGDPALAEEQGRITAVEAQCAGIQQILAPVADVNVDPDNPVINARSYGEHAHDVARYVAAFIRGAQNAGALATAKHFPGHGDTHVDSHRSLPVLHVDRQRLDRVELVPFRAAIEANVASIMIGHLAVPALEPTPAPVRAEFEKAYGTHDAEVPHHATLPATLSHAIITGLLRRELGYDGLVVTDAFDMGGLAAHFDPGEAAVRAIEAGNDQVLYSADTDAAIAAVKAAVRSGRISEARLDESYARIDALARRVGGSFDEIARVVDAPEHVAVAEEIARRAVTVVRDERGLLPLRAKATAVVVSDWPEENQLAEAVRLLEPRRLFTIDARTREDEIDAIDGDVIVLLLALRAKSGAGRIAMPRAARLLAEKHAKKTIAISFGSPYIAREIPGVSTYINAYGIQPVLQKAAINLLRSASSAHVHL